MEQFQIGDIVYLKSGSQAMTATAVNEHLVWVVWHDVKGEERRSQYPHAALTKEDPLKPISKQF